MGLHSWALFLSFCLMFVLKHGLAIIVPACGNMRFVKFVSVIIVLKVL